MYILKNTVVRRSYMLSHYEKAHFSVVRIQLRCQNANLFLRIYQLGRMVESGLRIQSHCKRISLSGSDNVSLVSVNMSVTHRLYEKFDQKYATMLLGCCDSSWETSYQSDVLGLKQHICLLTSKLEDLKGIRDAGFVTSPPFFYGSELRRRSTMCEVRSSCESRLPLLI
jgi:hypothetical protein